MNFKQMQLVTEFNKEVENIRHAEKKYLSGGRPQNSIIFNRMVDSMGAFKTAKTLLRSEPKDRTFEHPEVTIEYFVVKYAPRFKELFPADSEFTFTVTEVEIAEARLKGIGI
jgi:hypothetical protein